MASKDSSNGMLLTSIPIQHLSGPISLVYLKPTAATLQIPTSEEVHWPLMLLLGDLHRDESNRCEPCDAPTCYPVESIEFLQQLDELAKTHPIDFYTESDPTKSHLLSDQNILFKQFLYKTVLPCHDTTLRATKEYHEKCPTSYIRWHYTDIRHFSSSIEGYMYRPLFYMLQESNSDDTTISMMYSSIGYLRTSNTYLLKNLQKKELFDAAKPFIQRLLIHFSEFKDLHVTESLRGEVLHHLLHFFKNRKQDIHPMNGPIQKTPIYHHLASHLPITDTEWIDPLYRITWNAFLHSSPFKPSKFKGKEELTAYIMEIAHVFLAIFEFIHRCITDYFHHIESVDGSIKRSLWKQRVKQIIPALQSSDEWIRWICIDLFSYLDVFRHFFSIYFFQSYYPSSHLYTLFESLLQWSKRNHLSEPNHTIEPIPSPYSLPPLPSLGKVIVPPLMMAILLMEKGVVDMYTLLRMFKKQGKGNYQEEGVSPSLCIAFFGYHHVSHLRTLLIKQLHYQEVVSIQPELDTNHVVDRCLEIPHLPLAQDLEEYARSPHHRNQYRRRILEENTRKGIRSKSFSELKPKSMFSLVASTINNNNNAFYGNGGKRSKCSKRSNHSQTNKTRKTRTHMK